MRLVGSRVLVPVLSENVKSPPIKLSPALPYTLVFPSLKIGSERQTPNGPQMADSILVSSASHYQVQLPNFSVHKMVHPHNHSFRKYLVRAQDVLGIEPRCGQTTQRKGGPYYHTWVY